MVLVSSMKLWKKNPCTIFLHYQQFGSTLLNLVQFSSTLQIFIVHLLCTSNIVYQAWSQLYSCLILPFCFSSVFLKCLEQKKSLTYGAILNRVPLDYYYFFSEFTPNEIEHEFISVLGKKKNKTQTSNLSRNEVNA